MLSQYTPYTSSVWGQIQTDREIIVNLISLYFLLLGALLYFELDDQHRSNIDDLARLNSHLKHSVSAKLISDKSFYEDFMHAMKNAKSLVCICYFAPYPPDTTMHKYRAKYYKELKRVITSKPEVQFRRIVRNTPENQQWIKETMEQFESIPNFDLALIDDLSAEKMPNALSVQVIDQSAVWFVAIESHEKQNAFRDLYVEGEAVGKAMHGYFGRLWLLSNELISSGVLTEAGRKIKTS